MESLGIIWNFWEFSGIFGILENLREFLDSGGIYDSRIPYFPPRFS